MSGWLTKAKGAIRGKPPEQPEPFESLCACGVRHSGLRRRRPQRIICRQCGTALFVLPRDTYPPPQPRPARPKKKRKKGKRGAAVAPDAPPRFQQVATNVYQVSEKVGRKAADAGMGFGARLRTWLVAFLALWTPLRLILLACIAVCAATVAFVLLVDWSVQAGRDLKAANEAAREALADGQISRAYEELTIAVAALDQLDRDGPDDLLATELRQLHREARALRGALPISPLQVVLEADAAFESGKESEWQQRFDVQYRGTWLLVDAVVRPTSASAEPPLYAVSIPMRVGPHRRGIQLHTAVSDLDRLLKGGKPRAAIFAIQIESCELSPDRTTWKLSTDPDSAFLWGTIDNYEIAGFSLEAPEERERVEQVLAAQQRVLGLASADAAMPENADTSSEATGEEQGSAE